jgi:hypothetical protein
LSKKLSCLPFQSCPLKAYFPNNKMCCSIARHKHTLEEPQWTARTIPWQRNTLAYLRVNIKLKTACSMWPSNERIFWMQWICHGFILSGLHYKNITVVNDASRVISEWCHNLEHHSQSSITLLESSIMLLELSVMLLESIYSTGITHDDLHMKIIICW